MRKDGTLRTHGYRMWPQGGPECKGSGRPPCVFCDYDDEDRILDEEEHVDIGEAFLTIFPLNPVTKGHLLVVPRRHVADATVDPALAGRAFEIAAQLARDLDAANIITSMGEPATQTVFHLHLHVVPRRDGDGLRLPWS